MVRTGLGVRRAAWLLAALSLFQVVPLVAGAHRACAHDLSALCAGDGDGSDAPPRGLAAIGEHPAGPVLDGVDLVGHAATGGFNADVVAHDGTAYLGSWGRDGGACPAQGVRALSLDDLTAPALVGTFADASGEPDVAGTWTEKVVVRAVDTPSFRGDLAVVTFQPCGPGVPFRGFGLYDVSDPAAPARLSLVPTAAEGQGSHEIWMDVDDDGTPHVHTAIILEERATAPSPGVPGEPDYQVWDVGDPRAPQRVGGWGAFAELGVPPAQRGRTNFVHSVRTYDDLAVLSYWDLGSVLLDVADPAAPRYVGRTSFAADQEGNAHSSELFEVDGRRYLWETDEDFEPGTYGDGEEEAWGYSRVFDLSDPAAPAQVATFELSSTRGELRAPGDYTVHDPQVVGDTMWLSYYAEGLVGVDVSDPAAPRVRARFAPPPAVDPFGYWPRGFPGAAHPNVWGVEPVADERGEYLLVSDITSGMWVVADRRAAAPAVDRVAGADRVATAAAVSAAAFPDGAPAVVVARADEYADALTGAPLARALGAPLLLSGGDALPAATAAEVVRLGAGRAVLLGGEAALGDGVDGALRGAGLDVERVAGTDRFATAAAVAARVAEGSADGRAGQVLLVEGANADPARGWPDGVSASSYAAGAGLPVLLATADDLPAATRAALDDLAPETVTVVGGTSAVGEGVADAVGALGPAVDRLAGADRFATSALVAARAVAAGEDPATTWLATGSAFPDALTAGPAAAATGGVTLLAPSDGLPADAPARSFLAARRGGVGRVLLVGGPAALSDRTRTDVVAAVSPLYGPRRP